MAANDNITKKKCAFWDKCFRKNKKHLEEFLHPEEEKKDKKQHRLTHDISIDEEDSKPLRKGKSKRKFEEADDETTTPPKNKMKHDEEDEKISVVLSKPKSSSSSDLKEPKKTSLEEKKVIKYTAKKLKCKYWDECYQNGEAHRKEFSHPGDDDTNDSSGSETDTRDKNTSLNTLSDGGVVEFDTGYKLKRDGEVYSCSCKGFIVQRAPINERSCKHLKEYLGEDFEKMRVKKNTVPKKNIRSKINVSLMLAHKYDEKVHNPVGWWISEKLDGVRAFWNGRCFYSRLGNAFYAPEWFTKGLPDTMFFDGELFGGRGQFQSTVSIVKTAESPKWKDIKYYVFDSPNQGNMPFEERMKKITDHIEDEQPEYAVFVEQVKCKSKDHLDEKLDRILNIGGEGLMIRQPKSVYEKTRSKTLLKIKKFYDAEAVVIGHEKGKGRNSNVCGALRCRMACGKEFSVGSGLTDKDRRKPPKVGSIITYKFQELSQSGSPRFPTYLGIRIDMTEPKDAEIRQVLDDDS